MLKLKGMTPDNKIPIGALLKGGEAIKDMAQSFEIAKECDIKNEKFPQ
jgi:serine/threonine-protein phosphatase 2B catalytic subunit